MYAHNNETVDYAAIANLNAKLIKLHMENKNVSVVTDAETKKHLDYSLFDEIIVILEPDSTFRMTNYNNNLIKESWKNGSRPSAFNVTPYDNTFLVDVDYLIFSSILDLHFTNLEHMVVSDAFDITKNHILNHRVGKLPMLWATVVGFNHSTDCEHYFDYMEYVRQNYLYFSRLYGFSTPQQYRNDFALTIAHKELYMWGGNSYIHRIMIPTLLHYDTADFISPGQWTTVQNEQFKWHQGNVHIMNKNVIFDNMDKIEEWIHAQT